MTTYSTIKPKDVEEIRDKIVDWLNSNMPDPYQQAANKSRGTAVFVSGAGYSIGPLWPKMEVSVGNESDAFMGGQGKTDYLEETEYDIYVYYACMTPFKFTFPNGNTYVGEAQCRKYLQFVKDELKAHATDFKLYFHKLQRGTIAKPVFNKQLNAWESFMPLKVYTYKR